MTGSSTGCDPFRHDDAGFVLGALDPAARATFEQHLRGCPACTARVDEARAILGLLDGITAEDLDAEAVPDTLLPGLLRRARAERRHRHWFVSALASVAAACAIALAVVLWPATTTSPPGREMAVVAASPMRATAALSAAPWGTRITLNCHYVGGTWASGASYDLVVYDRHGGRHRLGSWTMPTGADMTYQSGTALHPDQITSVAVTLPNGRPLLRLTT